MNQKINTESPSKYDDLEKKSIDELITNINEEDQSIAGIVQKALPQIEKLITVSLNKLQNEGRLFYIGAGTSGRLGVLDASEVPPTYGVGENKVIGIIAGGDVALRKAVEFAEDDTRQAWKDLSNYNINTKDFLIGIAASGETPYVLGGIKAAKKSGIVTGCIVCNGNSSIAKNVSFPIELLTGAEFVTGSTRMKAGTAQKMVLNMITTSLMIKLGKVKGNKMVEMQLSNNKLWKRGVIMIKNELGISEENAFALIKKYGNVRKAIKSFKTQKKIIS